MFKYLSLKFKVIVLSGGLILSFLALVAFILIGEKNIEEQSTSQIHSLIQAEVEQKIKLATDSVAQSLGALVKGLDEKEQIAIIAQAIENFRFEDDKSGYFFAYKEYVPVAHPTRKDLIGKSLYDAKDADGIFYVRDLFDTAKTQTPEGKFVYFVFSKPLPDGTLGTAPKVAYAALIPHTDNIWLSTGVYIDTLEVYANKNSTSILDLIRSTLSNALLLASLCFFVIFVPLVWMFYHSLIKSIKTLQRNMIVFFKYLNKESENINLEPLTNRDEFGSIANSIQENIEHTSQGLDQDQALVTQSLQVIERAKQGYADTLIELKGYNPQLNRLRDSINDLLGLIQSAVGKNLPEIVRVFDSYTQLDFTTEVKDASGRVEVVT
ncbi:cache domain-containing protein, partial [Helicobacter japonicus]